MNLKQLALLVVPACQLDHALDPVHVLLRVYINSTKIACQTAHYSIFRCNYQSRHLSMPIQLAGQQSYWVVGFMRQYYQPIQIIFMKALLCLLLLALAAAENNNFDYSSHGADWAGLNPDSWGDCDVTNEGKVQQSPIEVSDNAAKTAPSFLFSNFYPADATLSFLNTTVYLKATTLGEIYTKTVRGDIIVMKATEMRFRSHAEHKFEGQNYYDLEMQVFFQEAYSSSRNERLGLSIMFEVADGASSGVLKAIKGAYPDQPKVKLDLSEFLSNDKPFDFYYYLGSATIPPCRDGALEWIVSQKVFQMSQEERDFFWGLFNKQGMDGNYRDIQPLRGNKIDYYHFTSL